MSHKTMEFAALVAISLPRDDTDSVCVVGENYETYLPFVMMENCHRTKSTKDCHWTHPHPNSVLGGDDVRT